MVYLKLRSVVCKTYELCVYFSIELTIYKYNKKTKVLRGTPWIIFKG